MKYSMLSLIKINIIIINYIDFKFVQFSHLRGEAEHWIKM